MAVVFNQLPEIQEASRQLPAIEKFVLPRLATLLVSYELQSQFNICLTHRHFVLSNDTQQVVELKSSNGESVASVFKNDFPDLVIVQLQIPKDPSIVPNTFLLHESELFPFEFSCMESREADQMRCDVMPEFLDN